MDKMLSKSEAYEAMRWFLEKYWERGGKSSDDIAVLLGSLNRGGNDFLPLDRAQWSDWDKACDYILELR